ncbi:helix-turn-helix transcriptional regulator [Leucobacter salsicius]|uniref:helix-turn-helix transcriptional regulator n=1 Tax=Leucobacter salsicius TaxID=664638 RepID=UPI00037235FD|nr:LuxR family transcriptional regulator [Leucobacter salsicius]
MIDDYHFATTPENDLSLLDLTSPRLRLIVIARRVCVLNGPLAARRVPMLAVTAEHLAFTLEEAREHVVARFSAPDTAGTAAALELACGWPLAIRAAFAPAAAEAGSSATPAPDQSVFHLEPLAALTRFAQHHLEGLNANAKTIMLAATLTDVIDIDQAQEITTGDAAEVRSAIDELTELGLLVPAATGDTDEFRCHPSVKRGIASRVEGFLTHSQRSHVIHSRATRIAHTSPLTAFRMYLKIAAYDEAELLLVQHFATITDEPGANNGDLRAIPKASLVKHPTFIAAQLFLSFGDPKTPDSALTYLTALWYQSIKLQNEGTQPSGELRVPHLMQAMVAARLAGDVHTAHRLSLSLEAQVDSTHVFTPLPQRLGYGARRVVGTGSLPVYLRELGTTAFVAGDLNRARSTWERLRVHAETLISYPWSGFPPASTRTVTDVESGHRWLLAALYERALTEVLDGNIILASQLLEHADSFAERTGSQAAYVTWVSGEVARANVSYELGDEQSLTRAIAAVSPIARRTEHRSLLLVAETESILSTHGAHWALSHMETAITRLADEDPHLSHNSPLLHSYHALVATLCSRFATADEVLAAMPQDSSVIIIEQARRALFAADDVRAILTAERVADSNSSRRQQTHRSMIIACAAWSAGRKAEAFSAWEQGATLIERFGLVSALRTVPHDILTQVAEAAQRAGIVDAVALVESVPVAARAKRYERLTGMEIRTLNAVAQHRTAKEASSALFITPATVKKHLNAVYRKLEAKGRDEALLRASRMGLLTH